MAGGVGGAPRDEDRCRPGAPAEDIVVDFLIESVAHLQVTSGVRS